MINTQVFEGMQYNSITELCAELARFANNTDDSSSLPKLELFLLGGTLLTGKIIKCQESNSQPSIWVDISNDIKIKQVAFIPVQNLAGLSILDLDSYLLLRETNMPLKGIGSLELKRSKLEIENQLTDIFGKNITIGIDNFENINEIERANANRVLEQLPSLFKSILSDSMSKKLMNDSVNSIQLIFTDLQSSQLDNGVLAISIKEKRTHTIAKEIEILKNEIESLI